MSAHGFKQVEGACCNKNIIVAPVTNEVTTRVVTVIIVVLKLHDGLLDVKGAFLQGKVFQNDKDMCL